MISIIIPSKNRPELVCRAISSVKNQSFKDYEIVLINDGSDVSYDHVKNSLDSSDVYIENQESLGVSAARNAGILQAKYDWILFLDDDDELRSGYLDVLACCILNNPGKDFFWSDVVIYISEGSNLIRKLVREWPRSYWNQDHLYSTALSIGASFGLAIKKEVLISIGLFDPKLAIGEDMDLVIRLLEHDAKPKSIPFCGINKFEVSKERLSAGFMRYSVDQIFERIFQKNNLFFSRHPYCKAVLIYFAASVHAANKDLISENSLLDNLFDLGFYKLYFEYKIKRFLKGSGFLVRALT